MARRRKHARGAAAAKRRKRQRKWIGRTRVSHHKGALHRMLHIPQHRKIPRSVLRKKLAQAKRVVANRGAHLRAHSHTLAWWHKLERRLVFALNVPHRRRR